MREVNVFKFEQQVIDGRPKRMRVLDKVALFHQFGQEADGEGQSNPVAIVECASGQIETVYVHMIEFSGGPKGMDSSPTLRDRFAIAALPSVISMAHSQNKEIEDSDGQWGCALISEQAYKIADTMLVERAK